MAKTPPKAPEKPAPDAAAESAEAPKKKSKLVLILALALLTAGGGGGAGWYFLGRSAEGGEKVAKPAPVKPPVFVPMDAFTVNLQPDDSTPQYLQVGLTLKVADAGKVETIKAQMPEIRNRVLLLLSSKKASDITTPQGKTALSGDLQREINQPLAASPHANAVDGVLFTSFVIQ